MSQPLSSVGIVDLLEADARPSFVVTVDPLEVPSAPSLAYSNPALSKSPNILEVIGAPTEHHAAFWDWITGSTASVGATNSTATESTPSSFTYLNVHWTRTVVLQKWVVVSANEHPPSPERPRKLRLDSREGTFAVNAGAAISVTATSGPMSALAHHDMRFANTSQTPPASQEAVPPLRKPTTDPGWILPDIMPDQEPFLHIVYSVDWASTPLGPIEDWPPRLHLTFNQILTDSRPIAIYWGKEYTTIYNEAFSKLCGSRHPGLLGRPVEETWPETGERLKETMKTSAEKQRASVEDEWCFFAETSDEGLEETYLKWSIVPVTQDNECLGFIHPVLETTSVRLWERRMKMLIDLGDALVSVRDVKSYWAKTIEELGAVEPRYDIPLAILYSVESDPEAPCDELASYERTRICRLEGSLGVPEGHPMAAPVLALRNSDHSLASMFREALRVQRPVLLQAKDHSLPESLTKGLQWRGFGDPCRAAVICPLRPTKEENVMGLLLLGLNPRRPYDNDYRQYISLLAQKLTTTLASTVLLEEEARRGRNAAEQAAYDQAMLQEKLALRTKEANESMQKFEAVADFLPVGMCLGDHQGNITYANDAWHRITGYPHEDSVPIALGGFLSCVVEEDQPVVVRAYNNIQTVPNATFEFRVKRHDGLQSPTPPTRNSPSFEKAGLDLVGIETKMLSERHVLASAKAERAPDGSITRVMTCLTDVTLHKQTAEEAVRRAQQAENLKRMAQLATVGMYDMDLEGRLIGANNVFFEMCGLEKVDTAKNIVKPWRVCVADEDVEALEQTLSRLTNEGKPQTAELRFRKPWVAEDGLGNKIVAPRWVVATFMPVRNSEGIIQSFTGCLSDVSLQKWQLERERQRKDEALESKRQQENFIDMTSHEMRNPLSAIIHCADAVIASLAKVQELAATQPPSPALIPLESPNGRIKNTQPEQNELIENSIDHAETIVSCAQHQKRIVDDILTMSKLDSQLLVVTPITVNPVQIVQEALKMFEAEARRVDIDLSMIVDQTYYDLGVEFLDLDPSRLKQVLINLLTNALKFTKSGPVRNVSVTISASKERPTDETSSVQFIPRSVGEEYQQPVQGRIDPVFLMFEVKDTGQGLSEAEKSRLFQRFKQASSRTHVKYGGSGLGLFISRRLTEMQNGAIGVASLPGVGSTFAFYVEAYRPTEEALREAEAAAAASHKIFRHQHLSSTAISLNGAVKGGTFSNGRALAPQHTAQDLDAPPITGILVVEDNLINQQITRRGLQDRGFTVAVANHGIEALEKLRTTDRMPGGKFPLSLILMDMEMPVQDGLTCTRKIRELEREGQITGGRIPIIAVSANARVEQILEARAAGCDDVLVKPYRMPELIEKMRVVVTTVAQANLAAGEDDVAAVAVETGSD
ncbi:Hybrid signal transduction histidine kinase A [Pleurostoma richardsiae]|uniref:Hybrid signal transduction histidine kinase A n=1 Tax=Pleurostoma richardsiae TaxID=41990 RepID=A0AA38VVQ4_9PEZI|nr:Hybrid signal transduction histidine kinase A [Pleurostoma richardsiae]